MTLTNSLSPLDAVLLVLVLLSVAVGLWRGLVFEVMSLAGWVVAWWVASHGAEAAGHWVPLGEEGGALRLGGGFLLAFAVTLLAWGLASRLVKLLITATPLTVPDRVLGGGFGLLRGVLLLLVLVTVVGWTPLAGSDGWRASRVVGWTLVLHQAVEPWLPQPSQAASPAAHFLNLSSS
ncbi:CvpA family protein [Ideonella sp. B7]|uniref:CvpA family protein n=1 Tax=Ideonella benzenivorans TaxID=2831643 RepID=UPI001CED4ACE|nr:CvpA family protein [Ideonella benzenivorans]MCA6216146.1 CvpA family protein [Ideonella benzenivorans]